MHPLVHATRGDDIVIFASKAGAPTHPAWYLNLLANPEASIEIGTETRTVRARVAEGDEREEIWSRQKQAMPGFADYEQKTTASDPRRDPGERRLLIRLAVTTIRLLAPVERRHTVGP